MYDRFKTVYANILQRLGMLRKAGEVLKYISKPADPHNGIGNEFHNYVFQLISSNLQMILMLLQILLQNFVRSVTTAAKTLAE